MNPRVLLVEDNETNRYLAVFLLEREGADVLVAHNGAEGVRLARQVLPDVIILDIQMPEMDGYEAARLLREDPATADIPLVAATACAMPNDRVRSLDSGFAAYIDKPIDVSSFARTVLALVKTAKVT